MTTMTPETWSEQLIGYLDRLYGAGIPLTSSNEQAIVAWENAEGGHWHNTATYNPLNTTQPMPGSTPMNSVGVQAYGSWDQGLQATAKTLENGQYGGILQQLKQGNSATAVDQAVVASPWGTKNIGGVARSGGGGGFSWSDLNPLSWPGDIAGAVSGAAGGIVNDLVSWAARLGASAVGAALIVVGLNRAFGVTDRISADLQTAAGAAAAGAEVAA